MDDFEQQIRNSLARKEPPAWLEAKILAAAQQAAERPWWQTRLRWVSALTAAAVLVTGLVWQRERAAQERIAGEAAKQRLKLALRITSEKLQKIQHEVVDRDEQKERGIL
jgi:hypothetical protein